MINKIKILITFFVVQTMYSQDTITKYLDKNWKEIQNIQDATYYRKLIFLNNKYSAYDYYIDGTLQMSGNFLDKNCKKYQGYFKFYFENGKIQSEGLFDKNQRVGKWMYYSENGYKDSEGIFIKGKKDGEWIWYHDDGSACAIEKYKKDKRIEKKFYNVEKAEIDISEAEHMASFNGGDVNEFSKWFLKNTIYPTQATESGIKGKVVVEFTVNTNGDIEKPKIVKSANQILDDEVLRVISLSPKWIPAKEHNKNRKSIYKLPINYK